jgi:hypothetical protein
MKYVFMSVALIATLCLVGSAEATNRQRSRKRIVQRNVQHVEKVRVERIIVREVQPQKVERVRIIERQVDNHCPY